ncbi:MAG: FG-GAP repeat protein [Deltaproteobacteria bacterium]|nr:FG-GAP repeat protein [Deltaproteobacteria bacterium]
MAAATRSFWYSATMIAVLSVTTGAPVKASAPAPQVVGAWPELPVTSALRLRQPDGGSLSDEPMELFGRAGDAWEPLGQVTGLRLSARQISGLAQDGDTLAVGLSGPEGDELRLFLRQGDTWRHQGALKPLGGSQGDHFGGAIAICGDVMVIGAQDDGWNWQRTGAAYVFVHHGQRWRQVDRLTAPRPLPGQRFGAEVACSGPLISVGAAPTELARAAEVHHFVRDGLSWRPTEARRVASQDP